MSRLLATVRNDVVVQIRKNVWTVAMVLAVAVAIVSAAAFPGESIRFVVPPAMLLLVGGSTLVFVGGLIMEEKERGILNALVLSPLRTGEYLAGKVLSLTLLSTAEVVIMIGGPLAWFHLREGIVLPDLGLLTLGILILNLCYTLLGIGITVRFRKVTDYLVPVTIISIVLQLPILYFLGLVDSPLLLAVPSAAPVMIVQGAFVPIGAEMWAYALACSAVQLAALTLWARASYLEHIVRRLS